jgi:hypothetical protein
MLASTTMIWIVIPLVVGLLFLSPPETTSSATDRTVTGCPFLRDRIIGMSARIAVIGCFCRRLDAGKP